jgi:hypothetical protein
MVLRDSPYRVASHRTLGSGKPNLRPEGPGQTFVYFAISLPMVTLRFMLVRIVVKLCIDRRSDHLGSRIRTKLMMGALALSLMPVFFMVVFNSYVMSRTLKLWFIAPNEHIMNDIRGITAALDRQTRGKALSEAIASMPEAAGQISGLGSASSLDAFCRAHGITAATILPAGSMQPVARFADTPRKSDNPPVKAGAPIARDGRTLGRIFVDALLRYRAVSMQGTPTSPYGNFLGFDSSPRVAQLTGKLVF